MRARIKSVLLLAMTAFSLNAQLYLTEEWLSEPNSSTVSKPMATVPLSGGEFLHFRKSSPESITIQPIMKVERYDSLGMLLVDESVVISPSFEESDVTLLGSSGALVTFHRGVQSPEICHFSTDGKLISKTVLKDIEDVTEVQPCKNGYLIKSSDYRIVEVDIAGKILWRCPDSLVSTYASNSDGEVLICRTLWSAESLIIRDSGLVDTLFRSDIRVKLYGSDGSVRWEKTVTRPLDDYANSAICLNNGEWMITGSVNGVSRSGPGAKNYVSPTNIGLFRFSTDGELLDTRVYGQAQEKGYSLIEQDNGNILLLSIFTKREYVKPFHGSSYGTWKTFYSSKVRSLTGTGDLVGAGGFHSIANYLTLTQFCNDSVGFQESANKYGLIDDSLNLISTTLDSMGNTHSVFPDVFTKNRVAYGGTTGYSDAILFGDTILAVGHGGDDIILRRVLLDGTTVSEQTFGDSLSQRGVAIEPYNDGTVVISEGSGKIWLHFLNHDGTKYPYMNFSSTLKPIDMKVLYDGFLVLCQNDTLLRLDLAGKVLSTTILQTGRPGSYWSKELKRLGENFVFTVSYKDSSGLVILDSIGRIVKERFTHRDSSDYRAVAVNGSELIAVEFHNSQSRLVRYDSLLNFLSIDSVRVSSRNIYGLEPLSDSLFALINDSARVTLVHSAGSIATVGTFPSSVIIGSRRIIPTGDSKFVVAGSNTFYFESVGYREPVSYLSVLSYRSDPVNLTKGSAKNVYLGSKVIGSQLRISGVVQPGSVSIFTLNGRKIMDQAISAGTVQTVDLSGIGRGVYISQIRAGKLVATAKFYIK